jgi:hypothetical protein
MVGCQQRPGIGYAINNTPQQRISIISHIHKTIQFPQLLLTCPSEKTNRRSHCPADSHAHPSPSASESCPQTADVVLLALPKAATQDPP